MGKERKKSLGSWVAMNPGVSDWKGEARTCDEISAVDDQPRQSPTRDVINPLSKDPRFREFCKLFEIRIFSFVFLVKSKGSEVHES